MPIIGLERYIKTVLKMPSEGIRSELITRLNNMSGLSGTPMSPLLTRWIQSNIGLFAVQKIQNYVAGGFSPDELRRFNGVFPDTFEGSVIRNELYDALTGGGVIAPVANFSGSPTTVYAGDTVSFTDLSTNTPTSWSWAFTGGTPTTSTTQNPAVVYNTAGTYGVDLTASNAGGSDPESKPNYIAVDPYLLDLYPSAVAAYSIRRLSSTYTGPAIRVRRSSDNTEQDIGFVSIDLDTTALSSFVGPGSGFVTIWYDQSGNSKDNIQTTSTQQPRIVNGGSIELVNGKPSIYFDGSNDYVETNATINIGTTISSFTVGRLSRNHTTYSRFINGKKDQIYYIGTDASENIVSGYGNNFTWSAITANSVTTWLNTQRIVTSLNNGTDSQFVDGVAKTPRAAAMAAFNNNIIIGGMYYNGVNVPTYDQAWQGTIQEYIVYNTYQSAQRVGIETNINSYFNIYP